LLRVRVVEREQGFAQRSRSHGVLGCDVLHSTTDHALTLAKKNEGSVPVKDKHPRIANSQCDVSDSSKGCVSDVGKRSAGDTGKRRVSER
jgi:hypothetical protein